MTSLELQPILLQLRKEKNWAKKAIKCVDKPNTHRILELVHCTLPMVGHIARCEELVLERAHQPLKRAIKKSNNRDIHMHAMRSLFLLPGKVDSHSLFKVFKMK